MRWDLLDRFDEIRKGERSSARKSFRGDEDFLAENFPGMPLVPEALLIEMIAQAGGVLVGLAVDFQREVILAKIGSFRSHGPLTAPCDLRVEARVDVAREEASWITGTVLQGERPAAEASILLVTMSYLKEGLDRSVVFSDKFLRHYGIRELAARSEAAS